MLNSYIPARLDHDDLALRHPKSSASDASIFGASGHVAIRHRGWIFVACIGVFCAGFLTVAEAMGDGRFVAKAAIYAADDQPALALDLPFGAKVPEAVLRQIVDSQGLTTDPEFASRRWNWLAQLGLVFGWSDVAGELENSRMQAVQSLEQAITLKAAAPQAGLSHLVLEVEVASLEGDKAARIADSVAQAIAEAQTRSRNEKQTQYRQTVANEVAGFASHLQIAKQKLADFQASEDSKDFAVSSIPHDEPDDATALANAKADVSLITSAIAKGQFTAIAGLHFPTPELDRLAAQYSALQLQVQKAKLTLGDKHPDMLALEGELQALQKEMSARWVKAADVANHNYRAAQIRAAAAHDSPIAQPAPGHQAGTTRIEKLQSDVELARINYEHALQLQAKAETHADLTVSPAKVPLSVTHRPHGFIAGAALILGAMFGAGRVLVENRRNPRQPAKPKKPARQTRFSIPRIKTEGFSGILKLKPQLDATCREVLDNPRSDFSSAVGALFECGLQGSPRGRMTALCIADQKGLGTTTIAVSLSQTAAKAGYRVLLIEANQQHPVLASLVSPNVHVDLIDLMGTQRVMFRVRPEFCVIPLFYEDEADALLKTAQKRVKGINQNFDVVIVDGGTFARDDEDIMGMVNAVDNIFYVSADGVEVKASQDFAESAF